MNDEQLRKALGYPRFKNDLPRVLILDSGYLVVPDIVDGARDLGWAVQTVATPAQGAGQKDFLVRLLTALAGFQPDFLVTVNHLGFDEQGELAGLLDKFGIPVASWFVDHPVPVLGGAFGNVRDTCQIFCFERTALPWLQEQGFADPVYLPTASNARHFRPDRIDRTAVGRLRTALSFAGNSWWTKARVEPDKAVRKAAGKFLRSHRVERKNVGPALWKKIERIKVPGARGRYALAQVVMAEASLRTRGRFARALAPLGLCIHGDPYWQAICPEVELKPFVDYQTELPALFVGSQVNANVTAEQMPTAVNQRVWDVPAVGAFLLTDAQEDALEFFHEGEEIAVYRSPQEAVDKARFYLERPEMRQRIARSAQEKVQRLHRYTHRLEQMRQVMRRRFG